ncbi:MAG: sensor histidine kinase [Pseudonocardiaceae bacterium]
MNAPDWITKNSYMTSPAKWDILLLPALFFFNCFTFSSWLELAQVGTKPWLLLVWLYGLVGLIPLIWRDRAPRTVFATLCALTAIAWPIMPHYVPAVSIPVALYAVSAHCSRRVSLLAMVASFIPNTLASSVAFRVYPDPGDQLASFTGNIVFLVLMTVAAWCAGRVTQASARHVHKLEQERKTARAAVFAERRRIARELHDIVSHAVAVIILQAAGAARVADSHFSQVRQSLAHIETSGRQAMVELQRLLGVLDAGEPAGLVTGGDELGPQPGLGELPALLTSLRTTGMSVTVDVDGTPRGLDPSVDLAAYRIVQEGLTNALKHAGSNADTRLRLAWEVDHLMIQIDNAVSHDGMPPEKLSCGRGLVGLRERAHAVGGHLIAGPHYEDRYRLIATLPLPEHRNAVTPRPRVTALAMAGGGGDHRKEST